jgi:long-chain fatty acid transport protein
MKAFNDILARAAAVTLTALHAGGVAAAGFQLFEQSGSGLGNAYAGGAAAAEDASAVYFNPAGMSLLSGHNVAGALHAIVPSSDFSDGGSTTALGTAASGNSGGDAGGPAIIPNLYFTTDMLGHGLTVGAGVNTPFGLKTVYDAGWVGRYQGIKSDLKTIDLKGSVSYKFNDMLSFGAGLDFMHANAELSNAIDFGAVCFARVAGGGLAGATACSTLGGALPGGGGILPGNQGIISSDGMASLDGDDWGVGYNLGVIFEPFENTRLGATFHSRVDFELEGVASFANPTLPGAFAALTAAFTTTGAVAKLTLPEVASFSVFSQLNPQWAVMADVTWTNWSRFTKLRVDFDNTLPDTIVPQQWDDSLRYSGGVTYTLNDDWKFRAGGAFDETPTSDAFRTPRIPDEERIWATVGISRRISTQGVIDVGYAHIFVDDSTLNKVGESDGGTLRGEYENEVNILSLQYTHSF